MLNGMQVSVLLLILLFSYSHAIKPPGYVEPEKTVAVDPNPPKYEYGYDIVGDKGGHQGKQEQRDGIYASGRYFVENKDSKTNVQYFADDWGYHPAVEYSNEGPHSKSSTRFALGHEAVVQLRNKENNLPQLQGLPDTGPLKTDGPDNSKINIPTAQPTAQTVLVEREQTIVPTPAVEDPRPPYDPFQQHTLLQEQTHPQNVPQPLPLVQHNQPHQQVVIQHIQQPVENVIFPQTTPFSFQPQQILIQQQPNVVLFGEQNVEHNSLAVEQKTIESEDHANAVSYQQFGVKIKGRRPNKLIENTQHLVTGQDVLDINSAITNLEETNFKSSTPFPTVTEFQVTDHSFKTQPIIVADVDDNKIVSTTQNIHIKEEEQLVSTTASTIEAISTTYESSTPTPTVVVTPRPVSPVTAGIHLEQANNYNEQYSLNKQNVQVEVQKTEPFYLGKYEYALGQDQYSTNHTLSEQKVINDIELSKTLLYFPGETAVPTRLPEVENHINLQQLPSPVAHNQFTETDQQVAQGYLNQVYYQHLPVQETKEVTKIIHEPYPVKVPVEIPYPVVKQVTVPVTVEKVVEKPVHITKYIEKPVAVPQPYPVEKIVEKPVHIPVQVTKYIDRPYPVHVQIPVPQPYPVDRVVQKIVKQPYPVEVKVPVPVDRIVEKKIHVPHYIDRPVEKIVEKPVPQYIDRPYPVHVQVRVPHYIEKQIPVEKIIDRPVPQYIDRPYPVEVKVPVPQPYYVKVEVPQPYPVQVASKFIERPYYTLPIYKYQYAGIALQNPLKTTQNYQIQQNIDSQVQSSYNSQVQSNVHNQVQYLNNIKQNEQSQSEGYHYPNPYSYAPQNNFYLPPKKELDNEYLPPYNKDCVHLVQSNKQDNYHGLLPPKIGNTLNKFFRKYRSARSSFDDKSVKMEYGFKPPLVPSLEIDEYGNPVNKEDK